MKKYFLSYPLTLMFLALLSVIFIAAYPAVSLAEDARQPKNAITVQGTSSITVSPSIAYISIGVTTFSKDAAIAQRDNAEKMSLVYKTLTSIGISKDKIKTITYNISPRYDYRNNVATLAGYNVTNAILVTVTDLKKVSDVLDMTVKHGINQANSITFGITDQENNAIYLKALAEAVADAKAKAVSIAAAAGITISKPANIIEGSSGHFAQSGYRMMDAAKMETAATPVSGGELKIEANVTVIYNF